MPENPEVRLLPIAPYKAEQFLEYALIAARLRQWQINHTHEQGFLATTGFTGASLGEEISFALQGQHARIECRYANEGDKEKARGHINDFVRALNEVIQQDTLIPEEEAVPERKPGIAERIQGFFALLKPQSGYLATPVIIHLNVLIYVLMVLSGVDAFSPSGQALVDWGANYRPVTLEGEAWRLITACFLHVGLIHLVLNMFALVYIGEVLEKLLGTLRFTIAYLLAGLSGSLLSLYWHYNTVAAGASGAIFGMYGVFLALLTTSLVERSSRQDLLSSTLGFIGYNLFFGMKGNIDNAAHLGGLLGGFLVGYVLFPSLKRPAGARLKYGFLAVLVIAFSVLAASVVNKLPNDLATYEKKMQDFSVLENKALALYSLSPETPDVVFKTKINEGIADWNKCLSITKEINEYTLPDELRERNRLIRDYCRLRIRTYNLIFKRIVESTEEYDTEIENCNQQVQGIVDRLNKTSKP